MVRKMKDSGVEWIGEIPEDWKVLAAKYHINIFNGSDPKEDGDIPVYGSGDIIFKYSKEYKVGPAVLLGRKGTIENPKYVEGKYWNVDTVFDVKSNKALSLKFYFYLSMVFDYKKYITSTALPSMTKENYENIRIPYPEKIEQKQIVERLDKETEQIKNIKSVIKDEIQTLEAYKKSVITEAVTKGLDKNAEMKDSGIEWIGEIPKHWEVMKLKFGYKFFAGGDIDYFNFSLEKSDQNGYPILANSLENDGIIGYTNRYRFSGNTITVTGRGLVGVATPRFMKYFPVVRLLVGVPSKPGDVRYSSYCINSFKICGEQTAMTQLTTSKLGDYLIPNPSAREQEEIANYLDDKCGTIDEVIAIKQNQLSLLDEYKKSLIYEYVTGKREA